MQTYFYNPAFFVALIIIFMSSDLGSNPHVLVAKCFFSFLQCIDVSMRNSREHETARSFSIISRAFIHGSGNYRAQLHAETRSIESDVESLWHCFSPLPTHEWTPRNLQINQDSAQTVLRRSHVLPQAGKNRVKRTSEIGKYTFKSEIKFFSLLEPIVSFLEVDVHRPI